MRRSSRLPVALLVVLTGAFSLGSAGVASTTTPPPSGLSASSTTVGVIGDSLTVGSASALSSGLTAHGLQAQIDAEIGRTIPGGINRLQAMRDGGFDSLVWVIALGTNDAWWDPGCACGITPAAANNLIQQMLDAIGPGRFVYWVNINRGDSPPSIQVFNQALAQAAVNRSSLRIIDFYGLSSENPGWYGGDNIHLNTEGYQARAAQITTAVVTNPIAQATKPVPSEVSPPDPDRDDMPYARIGDRGAHVVALQQALINRGFGGGPADGVFGPGTEQAVRSFQTAVGLKSTGIVTSKTATALGLPW